MNENMIFLLILGGSVYTSYEDFFHANVYGTFGLSGKEYPFEYTQNWIQLSGGQL